MKRSKCISDGYTVCEVHTVKYSLVVAGNRELLPENPENGQLVEKAKIR